MSNSYNYYFAETTTVPLQRSIDYHLVHFDKKIIVDCYENNKQHIECRVCEKTKCIFVLKYGAYVGLFTLNISFLSKTFNEHSTLIFRTPARHLLWNSIT